MAGPSSLDLFAKRLSGIIEEVELDHLSAHNFRMTLFKRI